MNFTIRFRYFTILGLVYSILMIHSCHEKMDIQNVDDTLKYEHGTVIMADEVWASDYTHIIYDNLYIEDAVVTIEPGTIIKLDQDASINIMSGGTLIADGSEKKKITFTRRDGKGNWKQLFFSSNSNSSDCFLDHCVFEYGGNDENYPAIIYCVNSTPTITNSIIRHSSSYGLYLEGDCNPMIFEGNEIVENDRAPIISSLNNLGSVTDGKFTDNNTNYIEVNDGDLNVDIELRDFGVSYMFSDDIVVRHSTLSISEGCTLAFSEEKGIHIQDSGSLIANGVEERIYFTALEDKAGFWQGININSGSQCILKNCVIEYGGSNDEYPGNLVISSGQHTITGCIIQHSINYGVYFDSNNIIVFSNNILDDNKIAPISMPVRNAFDLSGNEFKLSNRYIELRGGAQEGRIRSDTAIEDCNIPYFVTGDISIKNSSLSIASGVNLQMADGSGIEVLEGGGLMANGSAKIITITCQAPFPGAWDGIYFSPFIRQSECYINLCRILYGGGNDERPANIYCDNSSPSITNCIIEESLGYGIYITGSSAPILINNTYFNNLLGPVNN